MTLTTSPTLTNTLTGPAQAMLYIQHGQLFAFDLSELSTVPVTISTQGDLRGAVLNRDGKSLVYADQAALHWLDMRSGQTVSLLDFSVQPWQLFLPIAWSNTGYVLAQHIWDVESSEPVWITISNKSWHNLPLPEGTTYYGCFTGADWSPSTSQIAITGLAYAYACNNSPGLTIADVEKDTALRIVSRYIHPDPQSSSQIAAGAYSPAWSPNGTWIAFGLDEDAISLLEFPTRLYLVRPDGSDLVPLTDNPQGQARYPVWITDSRLFYAVSGVSDQVDGIYDCDLVSQKHEQMIGGTALQPLSISPDQRLFVYVQTGKDQQREMTLWDIERRQPLFTITNQDGTPLQFVGWLQFGLASRK